jgi:hypothetical protein
MPNDEPIVAIGKRPDGIGFTPIGRGQRRHRIDEEAEDRRRLTVFKPMVCVHLIARTGAPILRPTQKKLNRQPLLAFFSI